MEEFDIQPHSFHRAKGQRVIVEYVVFDEVKLQEADDKYFPDEKGLVRISKDMLEHTDVFRDYMEVMRLCKTYIADPVIFELCRQIEKRIAEILESRFLIWGYDRWLFENKPLTKGESRE